MGELLKFNNMTIKVTRNFPYKELFIEDGNTKVSTGLLTGIERSELAKNLLDAAYELLYHDDEKGEICTKIADIVNSL